MGSDILRVVAVFDKIDDLKTELLENAGLSHDVDGTATILVVAEHQHNLLTALSREIAQGDDHLPFVSRSSDEGEWIFLRIQHFAGEGLGDEGNAVLLDLVAQRLRRPACAFSSLPPPPVGPTLPGGVFPGAAPPKTDDEYRRMANDAERKAQSAKNDGDHREVWLRVAQGWTNLIRSRPQSDAEASGQAKSDS